MNNDMIMIIGVTASGKSKLGVALAEEYGAEIISIDSMKVYRRMDIGTAKPSFQMRKKFNYHLIDVVEPSESFDVGSYVNLADKAIEEICRKGKSVVAVGGTALYIKALLYGLFEGPGKDEKIRKELDAIANVEGLGGLYSELKKVDPKSTEKIHGNDRKRIIRALEVYRLTGKPISSFQQQFDKKQMRHNWKVIGLRREKEVESHRINMRVKKMILEGLEEEVKGLLSEEEPLSKQASCAIGYAEMINHLSGNISLEEAVEQIKKNTRKLAKNQRTWFKTFRQVRWIDISEDRRPEEVIEQAKTIVEG